MATFPQTLLSKPFVLESQLSSPLLQSRTEVFNQLPGMIRFLAEQPAFSNDLYANKKIMFLCWGDSDLSIAFSTHPGNQASSRGEAITIFRLATR